jgi:glycosyltransferase involved in cell wall biosynthesis
MRVLVISATFPPVTSGGADYALRLCQKIVERGHEVHVLTSKIENLIADPRITTYGLIERWTWLDLPKVLKVIANFKPDVVNLHFGGFLYNDHPMVIFLPTILRCLAPGIRFVTHIEAPIGSRVYMWPRPIRYAHRLVCELFKGTVDYAFGTLLIDSDHVIVLSEEHGQLMSKICPRLENKLAMIPPPPLMPIVEVTKTVAREKLIIDSGDLIMVYLGYLYPGKGIETLLESFKLATREHKNLRLVIIGGSPEMLLKNVGRQAYADEMKTMAVELGVADKIIWTGDFEVDSEMPSLYLRAADIGVMPWDWGVHLNNSSFGAAACHGLPIVTTWSPTSEDVFVDKENVYMCPPKDPRSVCQAINDLIEDEELREKLGQGALAFSRQWFSWDTAIDRTLDLYSG